MRASLLALLLLLLIACSTSGDTSTEKNIAHTEEPSELAQLMRVMEAHGDAVKLSLENGTDLPAYPKGIEELATATPTEGMHIDDKSYPIFAKDYQVKVAALHEAAEAHRESAYNNLIQSCSNCHHSHCPGPLMKIEKMFIPIAMEN